LNPVTAAPVNVQSLRYTAPFAVSSGVRVRAVAFAVGYNTSAINQETIA
jgi:hypothetical protein